MIAIKKEQSIQITVKIPPDIDRSLLKLSTKKHISKAQLVRNYIDKGLNVDSYKDDISFIRTQINEELNAILIPQIERIVKLLIKTGVMGVASFYLQGEVLEEFVPLQRRVPLEESIEKSKKKAAIYLKLDDRFMRDIFESLNEQFEVD